MLFTQTSSQRQFICTQTIVVTSITTYKPKIFFSSSSFSEIERLASKLTCHVANISNFDCVANVS